jgi:membrane dipeptidase
MKWFDGHLDLAYLAVNGRAMTSALDRNAGPHAPAAVTLPELRDAGVQTCLATIFTEANGTDAVGYPAGDAQAAHARGVAQLDVYKRWAERGEVVIDKASSTSAGDAGTQARRHEGTLASDGHSPPASLPRSLAASLAEPLRLIILMECADPIREPEEVEWWHAGGRGVRAIGLAWARGSRYASGNGEPSHSSGVGLTPAGRELVRHMDRLGIAHDVSHLSDRAMGELMDLADPRTPIIATHSNSRALLGDPQNQRHLTDAQIREIAARGEACEAKYGRGSGVIGLNLFGKFLVPGGQYVNSAKGTGRRATLDDAVAHVDHICSITGSTRHVALGSDMDGGFGAEDLPIEIERAGHLVRLAEALHDRGWSDDDIHAFAWGNWARVWGL